MKEQFGKPLSRSEMKQLVGGSMGEPGESNKCNYACDTNSDCDTTCSSCDKGAWGNQKFCFK